MDFHGNLVLEAMEKQWMKEMFSEDVEKEYIPKLPEITVSKKAEEIKEMIGKGFCSYNSSKYRSRDEFNRAYRSAIKEYHVSGQDDVRKHYFGTLALFSLMHKGMVIKEIPPTEGGRSLRTEELRNLSKIKKNSKVLFWN